MTSSDKERRALCKYRSNDSQSQCQWAEEEKAIFIDSIEKYKKEICKKSDCGLFWADGEGENEVTGNTLIDKLKKAFVKGKENIIGNKGLTPIQRLLGLVIIIFAISYMWTRPSTQPDDTGEANTTHSEYSAIIFEKCENLPKIPKEIDVRPEIDTFPIIKNNILKYIDCGVGPRVIAWLHEEVDKGDGFAALAIGDSYNPLLRETDKNMPLSSKRAYSFYRKAIELKVPEVACRLNKLKPYVTALANKGDGEAVNLLSVWKDVEQINQCKD